MIRNMPQNGEFEDIEGLRGKCECGEFIKMWPYSEYPYEKECDNCSKIIRVEIGVTFHE